MGWCPQRILLLLSVKLLCHVQGLSSKQTSIANDLQHSLQHDIVEMEVNSFGKQHVKQGSQGSPKVDTVAVEVDGTGNTETFNEPQPSRQDNAGSGPSASAEGKSSSRRFWKPPVHPGGGFKLFFQWRHRALFKFIRPQRLVTMASVAYSRLLQREHQAADFFGNGDGCVTEDEHPNFHIFLADLPKDTRRICAYHVLKFIRSPAFKRDVASVRRNHRQLLRFVQMSKQDEVDAIEAEKAELANVSIPVDNATHRENGTASAEFRDLEAEIDAQEETLLHESDEEFSVDEGLQPFPVEDKHEPDMQGENMTANLSVTDQSSTDGNNFVKVPDKIEMDAETMLARLAKEDPDATKAVSKKLVRRQGKKSNTGATWYIHPISRGCQLAEEGRCVTSPHWPSSYGNSQYCYMMPSETTGLIVESFNTEGYWDWFYTAGTYYSGPYGPQGVSASGGAWTVWYADGSVTRPGWKICATRPAVPAPTPCLYDRIDLCGLQLKQVPLLGTHNSGAYPSLYLECAKKKQQCVDWSTEARESCDGYVWGCKQEASRMQSHCTSWGSQCTNWGQQNCGWFSWFCGWFCQASQAVCTGTSYFVEAYCAVAGYVCHGFTYFVEYVGCNAFEWACETGTDLGIIGCLWENQAHGLITQIDNGVRYFDIDTCIVHHELRNCHGTAYELRAIGSAVDPDVNRIKEWLKNNPHEVLVLAWSNMEDGKEGVDYPVSANGRQFHSQKRLDLIRKYFTAASCTGPSSCTCSGAGPCYTEKNSLKLKDMISANVRMVVQGDKDGVVDSWTEESSAGDAENMMNHLVSFCSSSDKMSGGGDGAKLSAIVAIGSEALFESGGTYDLECPNHCNHPTAGSNAQCECKAGKGQVQTLTVPGQPGQLLDMNGTSNMTEGICNTFNAGVINHQFAGKMKEIVEGCLSRDVPVSVMVVDFIVSKSNRELQTAHQKAIDQAVTKFR